MKLMVVTETLAVCGEQLMTCSCKMLDSNMLAETARLLLQAASA